MIPFILLVLIHSSLSSYIDSSHLTNPLLLTEQKQVYPQHLTIFLHPEQTFILNITKNDSLETTNSIPMRGLHNVCSDYRGTVNNDNNSEVLLNLCDGIHGTFTYKNVKYSIRLAFPTDNATMSLINIETDHIVTKLRGVTPNKDSKNLLQRYRYRKSTAGMGSTLRAVKFIELYLVNDKSIYNFFSRNSTYIEERCKAIAKILDGKFRHLRIRIVLVGVEIWKEKDLIEVSGSSHATLMRFMNYRRHHINNRVRNDNAQFITKKSFDNGQTAGKAPIATICSGKYSAGINHDSHSNPKYVANVIAHELGHNLGMHHDHGKRCGCLDHPKRRCIMCHQLDANVKSFSECSRHYFEKVLQEGHGGCLFDFPTDKKKPSFCGNGIIEKGEECDCGHAENCAKFGYCCNQITCKLFKNATCASGECCHQCQYKQRHLLCRQQRGECDLPEFCSGNKGVCPFDVHIQDTHSCESGKGYCSSGVCMTHEHQCNEIFDNGTISADGYCYKEFNTKGIKAGHCGKEATSYKPCALKDAYCGKLQCEREHDITSNKAMNNKIKWRDTGVTMDCVSKHDTNHANDGDLALTRDGTRCGHNNICVNQKCISLYKYRKTINMTSCDPKECSHHGICNSNNNCHCDMGWDPPYCNTPGSGGSIDSGPPGKQKVFNPTIIIAVAIPCAIVCIICVLLKLAYMYEATKKVKQADDSTKSLLKDDE